MANRIDISFPSEGGTCTGWLYSPKNATKQPTLLMAHGLGATKEMALDSYAETFSSAGFVCIVFDYRHFGTSTGQPRYLIDIELQNKDWKSAIKYAKTLKEVDPQRLGLFGTSFSGGQVIRVAAECPNDIAAVVAQCPFSSGFRSALTTSKIQAPYMFFQAVRDYFFGTPEHPYLLPLAGEPGSPALMSAPDVVEGYTAIVPQDFDHPNTTPARIVLNLIRFFPGAYAKDVKCPIFFGICRKDSVAPASATISYAKQAPKGEVKIYEDMGHFDIYTGEKTQRARKDYLNFLKSHL